MAIDLRKKPLEKPPPGGDGVVSAGAGCCPRCGKEYPPRAKFCPECGRPVSAGGTEGAESVQKKRISPSKTKNAPGSAPAEKDGSGKDGEAAAGGKEEPTCGEWIIGIAVLAAIVSSAWFLVTSFPKTCFWIAAPIIGWYTVSGIGFKGGKAVLSILLLTGIVWWGLWAHSVL